MTRNTASAIGFGTSIALAAAAAGLISTSAFAETTLEYASPFVSTLTRAEVQAEFKARPDLLRAAASEWAMQQSEPVGLKSTEIRANAKNEYRSARQEVLAMTSEDSGSAYFLKQTPRWSRASATMGGAPH